MIARENKLSCHEAQRLMVLYASSDPTLTAQQRAIFARHMQACTSCATEYEEERRLEVLLQEYWTSVQDDQHALSSTGRDVEANEHLSASGRPSRPMTVNEGWERLKRSCPSLAEACRRDERSKKLRRVVWRIGSIAAAACIVIGITIGWMMTHQYDSRQSHPGVVGGTIPLTGFAELVTAEGRKPLALNQPITAGTQLQEILLGGMHRVVMNRHTKATFTVEPRQTEGPHAGKTPYEIQLVQGELYVEVVPGNPFTVKTANARLDITGTQFDVLTDGDKTELTLLKGSVRFTSFSQQKAVDVKSGYASAVVGRSTPTSPALVDAVATTAWAREAIMNNAMARADSQVDAEFQEVIRDWWRQPVPADPDTLDYAVWQNQPGHSIVVVPAQAMVRTSQASQIDWIELLMVSGDVWQFHYDPRLPAGQPLTKVEPIAIARLARHFGVDEREMFRVAGLPDSTPIPTLPVHSPTPGEQYTAALQRWHDALLTSAQGQSEDNHELMLFSLSASRYLATTRTAMYLWAKTHPQEAKQLLIDAEYRAMLPAPLMIDGEGAWLKPLRKQAVAARSSAQVAMEWFLAPAENGCVSQATEPQRNLVALVGELLPTMADQKREDRRQ